MMNKIHEKDSKWWPSQPNPRETVNKWGGLTVFRRGLRQEIRVSWAHQGGCICRALRWRTGRFTGVLPWILTRTCMCQDGEETIQDPQPHTWTKSQSQSDWPTVHNSRDFRTHNSNGAKSNLNPQFSAKPNNSPTFQDSQQYVNVFFIASTWWGVTSM